MDLIAANPALAMTRIPRTEELQWLPIHDLEKQKVKDLVVARTEQIALGDSIGKRVERCAIDIPQRVALEDEDGCYTYADLRVAVDRLATAIAVGNWDPSPVVAVSGQRSALSVIAFLAIEAVGGIYLPVDQSWPELRITDVLNRTGAACVIISDVTTASNSVVAAADSMNCQIISISEVLSQGQTSTTGSVPYRPPSPDSPRYILFTSGSAGAPKGAIIEHQGMVNHLLAKVADLHIGEDDCVAQTAPLTFDISIWQMLAALLVGGRVTVLSDDDVLSPGATINAVAAKSITILEVVPTILSLLLDEHELRGESSLARLRYLVATGEALPSSSVKRWISSFPAVPLVNAYGPTECSDDVTHEFVSLPHEEQVHTPIGFPIANATLHLLVEEGESFRSCANGEVGELFVGGICVGRGYFGDPDRTRTAFFRDPFVSDPTARLYRTGDLVRRTASGSLEYLGRMDRQVKISGVRMELGEIEETLRRHETVASAACVVAWQYRRDSTNIGDRDQLYHDQGGRLVAYVTGAQIDTKILRGFLSSRLPRSMVPTELIVLPQLPLTLNNKVDYRRLEDMALHKAARGSHQEPPAMYAHTALLQELCNMQAHELQPGTRALQVGDPTDAAMHSIIGLSLGITQVLPDRSLDSQELYEQCRTLDVSLVIISKAVLGDLTPAQAVFLRNQLSHVRIARHSASQTSSLLNALSGHANSPVIQVHYDANVASVASYVVSSEARHSG